MDQLLHETDGSRQMANQIAHRVFRQQGCQQDKCITGASVSASLFLTFPWYGAWTLSPGFKARFSFKKNIFRHIIFLHPVELTGTNKSFEKPFN